MRYVIMTKTLLNKELNNITKTYKKDLLSAYEKVDYKFDFVAFVEYATYLLNDTILLVDLLADNDMDDETLCYYIYVSEKIVEWCNTGYKTLVSRALENLKL